MATRSDRDGQVSWASDVTGVSAVTAVTAPAWGSVRSSGRPSAALVTLSLLHVIDRLLPWLATLTAVTSLITLLMVWSWLLDQPWGRWWPVPAALLPACIPLARSVEQNAPRLVQTGTVMALLLAVAVLQIYGQQRNQRDRIKTESALDEQGALLNAVAAAIAEQSALLRHLADGVATEEQEEEEAGES